MSDSAYPTPDGPNPAQHDLSVDLAAFLPEGVELGDADVPHGEADEADEVDEPESPTAPTPDLAALDQIEADLGAVDAALLALDAGTYGTCRSCGEPIDDTVLAASPTRLTCSAHA